MRTLRKGEASGTWLNESFLSANLSEMTPTRTNRNEPRVRTFGHSAKQAHQPGREGLAKKDCTGRMLGQNGGQSSGPAAVVKFCGSMSA